MLEGIIDLHVHTAPDVRPRRFDDVALARLAAQEHAAGVVLKGHFAATVQRAREAQRVVPETRVMGGLVLNAVQGGLNRASVEEACIAGARIVWMPTLDAAHHRHHAGQSGGIEIAPGGRLRPEVRDILSVVASHDIALATGHLSPVEIRLVLEAAADAGVRRLIVNHPEHHVTGLSLADQRALARDLPVYFERCFAQPVSEGAYRSNLDVNLRAIEALGPESTVLASDSGQMETAPWHEAWHEILDHLQTHGIRSAEVELMTKTHPRFLCGLQEQAPPRIPPANAPGASAPSR